MLKKLFWNIVIGIAHLIPAQTYKGEALEYLRYRRDRPKARPDGPKAIPTEPPDDRFLDGGPGDRLRKRNQKP